MVSENAGICVKYDGNRKSPGKSAGKHGEKHTVFCIMEFKIQIKRIAQHGKKTEFHVFPGGFVYGAYQTDQQILVRPVIEKMGERTECRSKDETDYKIKTDIFHKKHLHIRFDDIASICRCSNYYSFDGNVQRQMQVLWLCILSFFCQKAQQSLRRVIQDQIPRYCCEPRRDCRVCKISHLLCSMAVA